MTITRNNQYLNAASATIDRLHRGFRASDSGSWLPDQLQRSVESNLRLAMDQAKALHARDPGAASALYTDALHEWKRMKGER